MKILRFSTWTSLTITTCGLIILLNSILISGCISTEHIYYCNASEKPKIQVFLQKCMEDSGTTTCVMKASVVFACREEKKETSLEDGCGCQEKVSLIYDQDALFP